MGVIEASKNRDLPVGALVAGSFGMQDYSVTDGRSLPVRVYPAATDPTVALGVLGGTGMTAYFGLLDLGEPKPGQTVVVSGAAGATGSVAGQIARIKGCRVVGLAGGAASVRGSPTNSASTRPSTTSRKTSAARSTPRVQRHRHLFRQRRRRDPRPLSRAHRVNARVVICGGISRYNAQGPLPGPRNYFNLVFRRARMEGFIVLDYAKPSRSEPPDAAVDRQRRTETPRDGGRRFRNLPKALIQLFQGENIGKMMVKV